MRADRAEDEDELPVYDVCRGDLDTELFEGCVRRGAQGPSRDDAPGYENAAITAPSDDGSARDRRTHEAVVLAGRLLPKSFRAWYRTSPKPTSMT